AVSLTALGMGAALILAACGDAETDEPADEEGQTGDPVTLTWWHNSNNEPGASVYQQVAADFEDANPGVTIDISALAHEDMLTRLDAAFQTGVPPDVFMERGGGELAAHVEAGLGKGLSDVAADTIETLGGNVEGFQVDGSTYALPFSMGLVGCWYNTALFEEAGISEAPTTMEEFYGAVDALKAAGIEPVSVGAGDKWP